MIDFKKPSLADKAWVKELLDLGNYRGCDYSFANMIIWWESYRPEIARLGNFLAIRVATDRGRGYLFPAGAGDLAAAVDALEADAAACGYPFQLVALTGRQMGELEACCPGQFSFDPQRASFDYLYDIDRLADLPGKKLHAKRNHINRFVEQNPSWEYRPLTAENLAECLEMDQEWYRRSQARLTDGKIYDLRSEDIALRTAVGNFEALELEGGLIRVYGEVVAFTIGSRLSSDTFDVHFEKAYGELQGAYAMINRELARQIRQAHPEIRYLNREDDMGLEGLRKAKESYYPDLMVEKYFACRRG